MFSWRTVICGFYESAHLRTNCLYVAQYCAFIALITLALVVSHKFVAKSMRNLIIAPWYVRKVRIIYIHPNLVNPNTIIGGVCPFAYIDGFDWISLCTGSFVRKMLVFWNVGLIFCNWCVFYKIFLIIRFTIWCLCFDANPYWLRNLILNHFYLKLSTHKVFKRVNVMNETSMTLLRKITIKI